MSWRTFTLLSMKPDVHGEPAVLESLSGDGDRLHLVRHEGGEGEQRVVGRLDLDRLAASQAEQTQAPAREWPRPSMEVVDQAQPPIGALRCAAACKGVDVRPIEAAVAMRHQLD